MDGEAPNEPDTTQIESPDEPLDYQAASKSAATYAQSAAAYQKPRQKNVRRTLLIVIAAIVVIGLVALFVRHKTAKPPATGAGNAANSNAAQTPANQTITAQTKHYDSSQFALGFDYPADWTISDEPGSGVLSVSSGPISLTDPSGQAVTGQIVFIIHDHNQKLSEFDQGNATAVFDSEKISYTKPTANQRGKTYLSFLRYARSATSDALDGIYITGDFGYKLGQAIPKVDVNKVDPIILITFRSCEGTNCSDKPLPISIGSENWQNSSFAEPLRNILKSLSIS